MFETDDWLWQQRFLCEGQPPPAVSRGWGTVPLGAGGGRIGADRSGAAMPGSVTGRPVVPAGVALRTRSR